MKKQKQSVKDWLNTMAPKKGTIEKAPRVVPEKPVTPKTKPAKLPVKRGE